MRFFVIICFLLFSIQSFSQFNCDSETSIPKNGKTLTELEKNYIPPQIDMEYDSLQESFGRAFQIPKKFIGKGNGTYDFVITFLLDEQAEIQHLQIEGEDVTRDIRKAVNKAMKKIKFQNPATYNGQVTDVCVDLHLSFTINLR